MAKLSKKQAKLMDDFAEIQIRLPTPWPVKLRFGKTNPDDMAETKEGKDHLEILISSRVEDYDFMCYLLVHEYAHCLDFAPKAMRYTRSPHDPVYGVRWAQVHCEFFQTR